MTNVNRVLTEQMGRETQASLEPLDGFDPFMGVYVKALDGMPLPSESDFQAAETAWIAKQAKIDANASIKAQIATLEASCTERRWREAVMGEAGKAWLRNVDDQIAALRAQLT